MEMALTVVVFLGLGWLADRALGTSPLFMVVLVVFAMIGQSARMWFTYDARMRTLEEERRNRAVGGQKHQTEIVPPAVGDLG
jgi:F0F1-type ATP synthase assembly protein I